MGSCTSSSNGKITISTQTDGLNPESTKPITGLIQPPIPSLISNSQHIITQSLSLISNSQPPFHHHQRSSSQDNSLLHFQNFPETISPPNITKHVHSRRKSLTRKPTFEGNLSPPSTNPVVVRGQGSGNPDQNINLN